MATRRGAWIWNRVFDNGYPFDMFLISHLFYNILKVAPGLAQTFMQRKLLRRFDLENFGLTPLHNLFDQSPTISDELPNRIMSGSIAIKPNIEKIIGPKTCQFEDGTIVDDIDAIILATGYEFGFPFLEPGIITVNNKRVNAYK